MLIMASLKKYSPYFFLVKNQHCYVKFEVIDKLRNSLKMHRTIDQGVKKRNCFPSEITNSKRWLRQNIMTFIWIEQGTGVSNVNLMESVTKSLMITEGLDPHLKNTQPVVIEMNGIIRSSIYLFLWHNTFSDT